MIQSNKMIYQPPKYHHSNSFSHFLQLHSSINGSNNSNSIVNSNRPQTDDEQNDLKLDIHDDGASNGSNTSLEVVNDSIGKSFTIAAILGLKKPRGHHSHCDLDENASVLNDYNSDFHSSIINLTTAHSKLFQKFDNNDNHRHNYMHSTSASSEISQMPSMDQQQCTGNMYDNNNTSNSSYQEHHHLHKQQQHINTEFNVNYNRNSDEASTNPAMRNHLHHHHASTTNLLNKAFNRERGGGGGRMGGKFLNLILLKFNFLTLNLDHFPIKNKSSMSMKNKRVRTIFTPEQLERLEAEFERQQYMVGPERLYLAHTLQLTEGKSVKNLSTRDENLISFYLQHKLKFGR